jgi:SAM-dependent methyltransferase
MSSIDKYLLHKYESKGGVIYASEPAPSVGSKYARQSAREHWSKWRHSNYEFLREKLESFPDKFVIADLGCGESPFRDLLDRFQTCLKVDFTPYAGVNIVADLSEKLPIKSNSMDVVIASNTLEHLPDTGNFLIECYRILKPGGTILITVPFMIPLHQEPFDFLRFTEYQLKYLLEKSRFTEIEIKPLSNFFEIYQSIQNDFLNSSVGQQKSIWHKIFLKVFRKTQFFMTRLMSGFFEHIEDRRYLKGYGVVSKKKLE